MVDPKIKEILNNINSTPYGRALQEFLDDQIKDLSDLEKITSYEDALGRKYAVLALKKLFALMKVQSAAKQNTYE